MLFLSGCASRADRLDTARGLLAAQAYRSDIFSAGDFFLYSAVPSDFILEDGILPIVIEGDGYAWVNRYRFSDDPTPKDPAGLKIALEEDAVYLARPCQYVDSALCSPMYWTTGRYRAEVMSSYMAALDQLKARYGAEHFKITGFSGGAYIALNMAAMRDDVAEVVSVAGLLDPDAWAQALDVSPLDVGVSADDLIRESARVNFTHYCGRSDDVMPCELAQEFVRRAQRGGFNNHRVIEVGGASHQNLWQRLP